MGRLRWKRSSLRKSTSILRVGPILLYDQSEVHMIASLVSAKGRAQVAVKLEQLRSPLCYRAAMYGQATMGRAD